MVHHITVQGYSYLKGKGKEEKKKGKGNINAPGLTTSEKPTELKNKKIYEVDMRKNIGGRGGPLGYQKIGIAATFFIG